jgi:regulator of RNase E activity RraA
MTSPQADEALFETVRQKLFTAVVGDVMDGMGLLHRFLPPQIRPLREEMKVVGRAMTVLEADVFAEEPGPNSDGPMSRPFGLMLRALDDLKSGEVYLCTGASPRYALWGELMSTRARKLGAAGAVVDGYHRDTRGILALGLPTFSHGAYAQDQGPRGKVVDFRVPLEMGGVRVEPGDVVFGDIDGVCVVPRDAEEEVFKRALEKARKEGLVERAIKDGMGAQEAFDTFGVM